MQEFFNYQSPYRTNIFLDLNVWERIIPFIVVIGSILAIVRFRTTLRNNRGLDKGLRYGFGVLLLALYVSHYALRFYWYGFDTIVLPFHLCSIAMAMAIYLLFTNKQTIFTFVLLLGVLGAFISYVYPVLGYDSHYYRYYQFMIAHGILFITPIYYLIVHNYRPSKKDIIQSFVIIQAIAVVLMVFNYYMDTDFMFLFLDPSKIDKYPVIQYVGGIPFYLVFVELLGMLYFYGAYRLFENKGGKL
jgi:hypothetical integral membrane protein (TIGR02206 family)